MFEHACRMGLEGIVSKRKASWYQSGRSRDWVKAKNPNAPAVTRLAEEDWGRSWSSSDSRRPSGRKDSYLQAQFYRIKARRGPKKAIMAVVASILTAIYHMLKDGTMYKDLG